MTEEEKLYLIKRYIEIFQEDSECDISDFDTLFWNTSETEKTHILHEIIKLVLDEN